MSNKILSQNVKNLFWILNFELDLKFARSLKI